MDNEKLYEIWIKRADLHYKSGKTLADKKDKELYLDAGILLQQSAECYLKAVLIYHGETEKELANKNKYGHSFLHITKKIKEYDDNITKIMEQIIDMQYYAVTARYPDNGIIAEIEEVEIEKCLKTVKETKEFTENHIKTQEQITVRQSQAPKSRGIKR